MNKNISKKAAALRIAVLGGHSAALQFYLDRFPMPGDYLVSKNFRQACDGGKASNQAVAASRLGAKTTLLTAIGSDPYGDSAMAYWKSEGINVSHVLISEKPTGLGCGFFIDDGTPMGATMLGACEDISPEYVQTHGDALVGVDVLMLSLEIPTVAMIEGIRLGRDKGVPFILLNPSPADSLVNRKIPYVDAFTPNETEAIMLCGLDSFDIDLLPRMAKILRKNYDFGILAITLGAKGCFVDFGGKQELLPCPKVKAVDTSGAGDCFNSSLAFGLCGGMDVFDAARFAMRCASCSVTRYDSWPSYPTLEQARNLSDDV